jgi:Ni/Co efflux regulator RcnB
MNGMRILPAASLWCLLACAFVAPAHAQGAHKKTYYYHPVTKETITRSSQEPFRDENGDGVNDASQSRTKTRYTYTPNYRDRHLYSPYRYQSKTRYPEPAGHRSGSWWGVGNRLPAVYYGPSYLVDHHRYRLPEPPQGFRWVRVENDVYLVNSASGVIRDALYQMFY